MDDKKMTEFTPEERKLWFQTIGAKGGSRLNTNKGFGSDRRRASAAGRLSGMVRRQKARAKV